MQRQIKFRGKTVMGAVIYCEPFTVAIDEFCYEIVTDTLSQLVGTDSNGKEIYEGDTVLSEDGTEYTVKLVPIAENENEYVRLDTELDNRDFVLKEKTHD